MKLSILFGGDYAPVGRFERPARLADPFLFGDLTEHILASDVSCLNLELPLVTIESPESKAGPVMAAHPEVLNSVAAAGFNLINLANNHILDHGPQGLESTLEACRRSGLLTVGAGLTSDAACRPVTISRKGMKVNILAFAEQEFNGAGPHSAGTALLDAARNVKQIMDARSTGDALIVIVHGGNEFFDLPRPGLREVCHMFAQVGADAVICHHSHVCGAYECIDGVPIHYGLGNLVFDHQNPPKGWNQGYAVRLHISINSQRKAEVTQELFPFEQDPDNFRLRLLDGEKRELFFQQMAERNRILADKDAWERRWVEYCNSVSDNMLGKLALPKKFRGSERLFRILGLKRLFFPSGGSKEKLNLLRCPSHREVLITLLDNR